MGCQGASTSLRLKNAHRMLLLCFFCVRYVCGTINQAAVPEHFCLTNHPVVLKPGVKADDANSSHKNDHRVTRVFRARVLFPEASTPSAHAIAFRVESSTGRSLCYNLASALHTVGYIRGSHVQCSGLATCTFVRAPLVPRASSRNQGSNCFNLRWLHSCVAVRVAISGSVSPGLPAVHHSNLFRTSLRNIVVHRFAHPHWANTRVRTRPLVASDGRHPRLLPNVVGPCLSLAVQQRSAAGARCWAAGGEPPPRPQTSSRPRGGETPERQRRPTSAWHVCSYQRVSRSLIPCRAQCRAVW